MNNKINGLDSIRFICAIWVVFGHFGLFPLLEGIDVSTNLGWFINAIYNSAVSGPAAVIVFFVISGLCIHYPYRNGKQPKLLTYYARRYSRITIPLLVAIFFANLLGTPYSFFEKSILWSIAAEIIYYTLYPVIIIIKKHIGWDLFIWISFLIAFSVILLNPQAGNYASYTVTFNWLLGLPCWLLGCKLAESDHLVNITCSNIWIWRLSVWLASCVCLILRFHTPIGYPYTLNIFAILVYFWLQQEIYYFKTNKPLIIFELAGRWSYSMYLMHLPASKILSFLKLPDLGYILNWSISIVWVLVISYAFYILVEKPSHNFTKAIKEISLQTN